MFKSERHSPPGGTHYYYCHYIGDIIIFVLISININTVSLDYHYYHQQYHCSYHLINHYISYYYLVYIIDVIIINIIVIINNYWKRFL